MDHKVQVNFDFNWLWNLVLNILLQWSTNIFHMILKDIFYNVSVKLVEACALVDLNLMKTNLADLSSKNNCSGNMFWDIQGNYRQIKLFEALKYNTWHILYWSLTERENKKDIHSIFISRKPTTRWCFKNVCTNLVGYISFHF